MFSYRRQLRMSSEESQFCHPLCSVVSFLLHLRTSTSGRKIFKAAKGFFPTELPGYLSFLCFPANLLFKNRSLTSLWSEVKSIRCFFPFRGQNSLLNSKPISFLNWYTHLKFHSYLCRLCGELGLDQLWSASMMGSFVTSLLASRCRSIHSTDLKKGPMLQFCCQESSCSYLQVHLYSLTL